MARQVVVVLFVVAIGVTSIGVIFAACDWADPRAPVRREPPWRGEGLTQP